MLKEELVKNLQKALTSWQKVKVTSCILPKRYSNSVEKLIRYSFIHKDFLLIHEELPDLSIYIAFFRPFIEKNEPYFIRGKYILQHPLLLANFPCEIKKINNKYNNKFKNFYLGFTTTITLNYIWNSSTEEDFSEMTCYF